MFFKPNVARMKERRDVPGLLRALSHQDEQIWKAADEALNDISDPSTLVELLKGLKDPEDRVRSACVSGLGRIGDLNTAAQLLQLLFEARQDRIPCPRRIATQLTRRAGATNISWMKQ